MKKVLVCGSRDWSDRRAISLQLQARRGCMVIEGGAPGADTIAGQVADALGMPHATVRANWDKYGRAAGPIRNRWMLDLLGPDDEVLAFHPDLSRSKGTKDCVEEAQRRGFIPEVISGLAPYLK